MTDTVRIGAGAGFATDRIEPAVDLARDGRIDYLVFECLAEINVGAESYGKDLGVSPGYNGLLEARMERVLEPCLEADVTVVTNMGSAAPRAAAERTAEIADERGLDAAVAAVVGSDVSDRFDRFEGSPGPDDGAPTLADVDRDDVVCANAYMGVDGVLDALAAEADVVVTDRVSDVSLFLAPLLSEFGWRRGEPADAGLIGQGIVAAHLLECAGHVTGGYFADPGYKDVDGLDELGFPIGEVSADGSVVVTKLPEAGGQVTERTCKEQLLYEIHDPGAYVTPDGVADFTSVEVESAGPDRVRVSGATAGPPPDRLKVNVALADGVKAEAGIGYAGPRALERARLAGDVVRSRLETTDAAYEELRIDHLGVDAMHGEVGAERSGAAPYEVRLRVAARCETRADARRVVREVQALGTNGPAGGGGVTRSVDPTIGIVSTLIDREATAQTVESVEAGEGRAADRAEAEAGAGA